jgi:hypothetical protein
MGWLKHEHLVLWQEKEAIASLIPRMHHQSMSHDPTRDGNLDSLRVELETGMTFVTVAETATHPDKIKRNFHNAKKLTSQFAVSSAKPIRALSLRNSTRS